MKVKIKYYTCTYCCGLLFDELIEHKEMSLSSKCCLFELF